MIMDLTQKKCVPCEGGTIPLTANQTVEYLAQLTVPWESIEHKKIKRQFVFKDFMEAMVFVNKVAEIAQSEGHHPDMYINYNKVIIELTTHAIGGLSENDFIVAAKIDGIE